MGGVARAVGNLYDLNGNRIRVIHPDNAFLTYELDGLGRPKRIRENGSDPIVDFAYDAAGRRASSGWAATTSYAYDPAGRLQTLSHNLAGTSRDQVQSFTYNPASQIRTRSASNDAYAWTGAANTSRPLCGERPQPSPRGRSRRTVRGSRVGPPERRINNDSDPA